MPLPSKQDTFTRELEKRIEKPDEEPRRTSQEPQRTTEARSSGGEAQRPKIEQLQRELADLENQYERRKNLEVRRFNDIGQRLLGYHEGFTWCPKCHYVSNISPTSELRHNMGLRGGQRRSCKECYQWPKDQSPYEEEDFLYEGPKPQNICEAY